MDLLPYDTWPAGISQADVPANNNALRSQVLAGYVISKVTDAQPGSPAEGDIYIITGSATGAQWSTFTEDDLAIYSGGTWYAFTPYAGLIKNVAGTLEEYSGSAWAELSVTGDVASVNGRTGAITLTDADVVATVVTDSGTSRTLALSDRGTYIRFTSTSAKTLTVNTDTGGADGEYHFRNAGATGDLTITASGVTINAPKGGTLVLEPNDSATLKRIGSNAFDLIGSTAAA